ncbi:MAG: FMN reductase (NAD(P)H) [candidate division CPR1 bacterium ADurb.Bin160]|uniref:FMN reductase (NAD(P)H) n=1 Tax=candidate division CPR1 bacterium ADurb.Bin160 TaxID=1852826 RepID=A0A1V5ZI75_9BACT|nr:MAG: FMN reductase (NAD(P)H) [candidate division CPR1 bacterium ADurb.Bin160]
MDSIFLRRSIRRYKDKPVEKSKIEGLLRAAMQAPSAGNQQPWEFIVVENKESLKKLSEMSKYSAFLKNSPLVLVVLGNKNRMMFPEYWQQDLGAAAENILLEAVEQGLGGVWLGAAPENDRMDFIRNVFSLPENILPFALISIGYGEDENRIIERYDESRVHFEKY